MPIGSDGQITAVATPKDISPTESGEIFAVLMDHRATIDGYPMLGTDGGFFHWTYAVLLSKDDFTVKA